MPLSRTQALSRLQTLKKEVKALSAETRATISRVRKIEGTISEKRDTLKTGDLRKRIASS